MVQTHCYHHQKLPLGYGPRATGNRLLLRCSYLHWCFVRYVRICLCLCVRLGVCMCGYTYCGVIIGCANVMLYLALYTVI